MTQGGAVRGGAVCFYHAEGKGPAVLFLHGNGEDHRVFDRQVQALEGKFDLILMDSRGHGQSAYLKPLTLTAMAEDAVQILDQLSVEKAAVVGFSDGGNIALHMAISYPERVSAVVLAGANLHPRGIKRAAQWPVDIGFFLCGLFAPFSGKARHKRDVLGLMIREPRFTPEDLKKISAPVLVLAGDRDLVREEHTKLIAANIKGAKMRIIKDCDHFLFAKKPEEMNAVLLEFLSEVLC